jgi:hypothetical protein
VIVPFEAHHLNEIALNPVHRKIADLCRDTIEDLNEQGFVSVSTTKNDEKLAILGAAAFEDIYEVFILPSLWLKDHRITFWRDLRREVSRALKRFNTVRAFEADPPALNKYFLKLGFHIIGPAWRAGKDGILWEKTRWA